MSLSYTPERPLRVAVIGAGPAGFFACDFILKSEIPAAVDLIERLPTPYGLVRYGVSPDHMRIRNVTRMLDRTADLPGFRFLGNVEIGRDLSVDDLRRYYDAVVFANGCPADKLLHIPGEELDGVVTATHFAAWYNGHPDYMNLQVDLSVESVAVIGVGNVAVDVARMLARGREEFADTDTPASVVEALGNNQVKAIHMIARRSPGQAAFSPKELSELMALPHCDLVIDPADLVLTEATLAEHSNPAYVQQKRNFEMMREYASKPLAGKPKQLILHWLQSPVRLEGEGSVQRLVLGHNRLEGPAERQRAVPTGAETTIDCGLFLRSIGHRGAAIAGVPFDDATGVYPNDGGRLRDGQGTIPGFYAVGWVRRGPVGVIGATKQDANEVIGNLLADVPTLPPCAMPTTAALDAHLQSAGVRVVTFADWQRLDAIEEQRAAGTGRVRERFTSVAEALAALDG